MKKEKEFSYRTIFTAFLKTGSAFGGGLGVLSSLREQFVKNLKIVDDNEFLAIWGLARIVPGGTISAIAIALGYKCKKLWGALVAITALTIPGFSVAIILSILYLPLKGTVFFSYMNEAVLPAALGLIVLAIINLGRDVFTSRILVIFSIVSFIASSILHLNPTIILLGEGFIAGIILTRREKRNVTI